MNKGASGTVMCELNLSPFPHHQLVLFASNFDLPEAIDYCVVEGTTFQALKPLPPRIV